MRRQTNQLISAPRIHLPCPVASWLPFFLSGLIRLKLERAAAGSDVASKRSAITDKNGHLGRPGSQVGRKEGRQRLGRGKLLIQFPSSRNEINSNDNCSSLAERKRFLRSVATRFLQTKLIPTITCCCLFVGKNLGLLSSNKLSEG